MSSESKIGLIGLAVMGQNLALNMADHGFRVSVYNRTASKTEAFVRAHADTPGGLVGFERLEDFVRSLERPRKVVIMVQAGGPTDAVIESLVPLLEEGDILIDGGNAYWRDTVRREAELRKRGLRFIGSGVSGGEEGARFGPSLMPGGERDSWEEIRPIWEAIAAKVDEVSGKPLEGAAPGRPVVGGVPCTTYIGPNGAGHFVKMVHNGIEYGDMQLISEAYFVLRYGVGLGVEEMAEVFEEWNRTELDSFLIEITAKILRARDERTGQPMVDVILDAAGQKGTGKWTIESALEFGVPCSTMSEAVFARCMSAMKEERVEAAKVLRGPGGGGVFAGEKGQWVEDVRRSLYASKICSYAQGFALMRAASEEQGWGLRLGDIAMIFRGGCIIRARFLQRIKEAFDRRFDLRNLLMDEYFRGVIEETQGSWRRVVGAAVAGGIPVPAFSASLAYYDSYRLERGGANLLQAQRDFFGAHTYERVDVPRGRFFHRDWIGDGKERAV